MIEKIEGLASVMTAASGGRVRIAFNEMDNTTGVEPEAHRFLKLDELRLGRDLKTYEFMSEIMGQDGVLCHLLEEVVLPAKNTSPEAYTAGLGYLKEQAPVFGKREAEWRRVLDTFKL